jgi:hypothetical protein
MAKIKIVVSVINPIPPVPPGPDPTTMGDELFFTEDVVLKQYKGKTPGHGLPKKEEEDRFAGTHSTVLTLMRIAGPGDRFFQLATFVFQYVATYRFNDLAKTPLKKGQITAQGVLMFDSSGNRLDLPHHFAITGGTDIYAKARGEVLELHNTSEDREFRLVL